MYININIFVLPSAQNIFNSLMCLLFAVVLALLQFRVIRDSHLPFLCYGILFFTAAFCFISMPTVGNVFPVDTKEVRTYYSLIKCMPLSCSR